MNILKKISVPTGTILIVEGEKGKLEMLSLYDYGKEVNVKCDAIGMTRDIEKVEHTTLLPLTKKWVITVSTQYGCSMGCSFCDVPKVGAGINATRCDLVNQVIKGLSLHPEITETERLNIHYARMGEPTWNADIIIATHDLLHEFGSTHNLHPVVSTMMPKYNKGLVDFINKWMYMKNVVMNGNAGLQISINSTNEQERFDMFNGNALRLSEISSLMNGIKPVGRKITLNFAIADWEINPNVLLKYFNPDNYLIKLTPMHKTNEAVKNDIKTNGDYTEFYPYRDYENCLKEVGYDVLVFIASKVEDESRITCGNAILSERDVEAT